MNLKNKIMKFSTVLALAVTLSSPMSALAAGPKVKYTQPGVTVQSDAAFVRYVSIDDIKNSLKDVGPINVSFDIDDTLLFSSQYFQYGKTVLTPGKFDFLKDQKFWDYVALEGDAHSIPKVSTKELIKMHMERGDNIFFITGRTRGSMYSEGYLDKTSENLKNYFNMEKVNPIDYTADTPRDGFKYDKSYYIKKHNVSIHYGDSDDDVLAAKEVGIRPIRIFRAPNSTNMPLPQAGGYGEEVLRNSAF
ncbi:acid phosphatase (class B) [Peptoniphilus olsenii]|uniref:Class B acid phosphatase n=1 Tax=Peptoniphilus olsenii TaxID=411570 RepID=A0ABV2J8W5_9FIRM